MSRVNYNFTEEQQVLFTTYYEYVKENHSSLLNDKIMKEKTKTMLAFAVINGGDIPELPEDFKEVPTEDLEGLGEPLTAGSGVDSAPSCRGLRVSVAFFDYDHSSHHSNCH